MASTVRRRPNAFNLWHQLTLAKKMNRESVAGLDALWQHLSLSFSPAFVSRQFFMISCVDVYVCVFGLLVS